MIKINMQKIDFSQYQVKETKSTLSQRAEMIKKFVDRLDSMRGSYPPVNPRRIAILLSPLKTITDLYQFYGQCEGSNHFAKYFYWSTNPKNAK
jgi:hypothetical protein